VWPLPPLGKRVKTELDRLLRRETYAYCSTRSDAELGNVVDTIRRKRPEFVIGFTQAIVDLARFIVERGLRDWDDITVLPGAERLYPGDRRLLQEAFGRAVFETYGCREFMMLATECEAHDGLHLSDENLVVELLVRADIGGLRPARPGEVGEVVVTDLHNYGMPFIRYPTGDRAVAASGEACSCGRSLGRLGAVEGRVAETLTDSVGTPVDGIIFPRIFSLNERLARSVRQWQAVQHLDKSITLRLVVSKPLDAPLEGYLRRNCERFIRGVRVSTEIVDAIPPAASGKRQVVVVER
jgi:phenylacetate-CoA ligase